MEVRITKLRVAMAARFVLAGVGLASLLGPLVGSALANVGQVVNISDPLGVGHFAKVDSAGKLSATAQGPTTTMTTADSPPTRQQASFSPHKQAHLSCCAAFGHSLATKVNPPVQGRSDSRRSKRGSLVVVRALFRGNGGIDWAGGLPELRQGTAGEVPVLSLLRLSRDRSEARGRARGAQGRHLPLRRPGRLHVAGRADGPRGRRALLSPYHARLRAELERFGGTVEKFIGDAVMALFGAPGRTRTTPNGQCARRSRSATGRGRRRGLQVRIGVATGEALVALDARPERGRGDGGRRRRQHRRAPPGGRAGERDPRRRDHLPRHRARDRVRTVEPVEAKGKAEPITVWEAVEAPLAARASTSSRRSGRSSGRGRELDVLGDALAARAPSASRSS